MIKYEYNNIVFDKKLAQELLYHLDKDYNYFRASKTVIGMLHYNSMIYGIKYVAIIEYAVAYNDIKFRHVSEDSMNKFIEGRRNKKIKSII